MIELVIVLFKQLLAIPDRAQAASLQKRLLLAFAQESVFDAFNFLTQEFKEPFQKKLAMHVLEIHFHIFKHFTPSQILSPDQ